MIIPLDKAVKFYELKQEVRSLLKACLYHPDMHDPEGWLRQAIDLIESIDATPDEVAAIEEEGK